MRENTGIYVKRITFIAAVLLAGLLFPVTAQASIKSGTCGSGIGWAYNTNTKTLTILKIAGTGKMNDYSSPSSEAPAPWFLMNKDNSDDDFDSSRIEKVVLGKGITYIGNYAFNGLYISEVSMPDTIEQIGKKAFAECEDLEIKTLPPKLKIIGDSAFSRVYIRTISLPSSCISIGKYAFSGGILDYIYIPPTVKSIGKYAFGFYAHGWDDDYELDDSTPKKDIKKTGGFYVVGPSSNITSSSAYKYAKAWGLEYRMKGVKAPKIKRAKNVRTRRIYLKWKKKSGSGYQIRYSKDKYYYNGTKYITINKKKTTSRRTAKLSRKKTYYISIRYFKKINGKKCYSEWSPSKKIKIKK